MCVSVTTDATFDHDVLASSLPVLVEFTADWCQPCRTIAPVLEQISTDEERRLRVVTLDVDVNPKTAGRYHVLGMPTVALFSGGEIVSQFIGARPRRAIMHQIEPYLG